ncbi:NAD(P)-dependent dehydrogenase (short-subunit alcohol dehydrogenase family) [Bradyrhizobium sp. LM6.10]
MKKLEGKIAVITGGSSGIGLATAKRFVEEGAHVVITGRREKELKEATAFIERNVTTVVGDVSRLEDLDRLYGRRERETWSHRHSLRERGLRDNRTARASD